MRAGHGIRRGAALLTLSAAFVALLAAPALAHAVLLQTTPGEGAVLTTPPKTVSLRFTEQVSVTPGSVRVYDTKGSRVDTGTVTTPSASLVQADVRPHLADGAYVVTWRVISADTHPVAGAFAFQVGLAANATAPNVTSYAQQLLHRQTGDQTVGVVYGIARGVLYAGVALLIGALAFATFVWPGARRLRRAAQLAWGGLALSALATVVGLLVQGIYGAGLGFGSIAHTDLLRQTLGTQFGHMSILRLVLLGATVPALRLLWRDPHRSLPRWWSPALVVGGLALALTFALSGHAHTGDWTGLAIPADTVHVVAMGIWLGGLAVLAYAVFPGRQVEQLREVVPRFSRTAFGGVLALVVTGVFQGWRQVGSIHALRSTTYGQLLFVKVILVLVLVVIGALSRQIVGYLFPAEPPSERPRVPVAAGGADDGPPQTDEDRELDEEYEVRRLRHSVLTEVAIGIAVIAVTALLVNAAPAKVAASQHSGGVAGVTLKSSQVWVDLSVTPGVAPGSNDVHVTAILPSGAPINLQDLTATIDYPSRHIAPLTIPLRRLGPGHYLSPGFTIPFAGNWRVTAHALLSQFDEVTLAGTVPIA